MPPSHKCRGEFTGIFPFSHSLVNKRKTAWRGMRGSREVSIWIPSSCEGEIVLPAEEKVELEPVAKTAPTVRYRLPAGKEIRLSLTHS